MNARKTRLRRLAACLMAVLLCLTGLSPAASALDIRAASAFVMDYQTGECLAWSW